MADEHDSTGKVAVATCNYCKWRARLTGDDWEGVAVSLRKILIDHVRIAHPEVDGEHVEWRIPE